MTWNRIRVDYFGRAYIAEEIAAIAAPDKELESKPKKKKQAAIAPAVRPAVRSEEEK